MRVAFRADASLQISTGHVMRCLTLADSLREQGTECQFVCREHEGHLMDHISSRGYEAHALPAPSINTSFESDLAHASWLGVDWKTDGDQTRQALSSETFDWLIVDHYALDHRWESALRSSSKRIMAIDDLADRRHDCDLLLDQNYGSSTERYAGLVPAECTQLHGSEFALLKPIYAQRRAEQSVRSGKIERVLIYFGGGADLMNLTGMALHAFQAPELKKIELDIVVGSSYAHKAELEAAANRDRTHIHKQLPDLSEVMARADLAIGACGATTWERCCLGLPSILVVCALNQEKIGEGIAKLGAGVVLYPSANFSAEIREQVVSLSEDTNHYLQMGYRSKRICDGLGVSRVAKEIISTLSNPSN